MWRTQLETLLREGSFGTQQQLADALQAAGHQVTQSSISRELKALGVVKVGKRYVLPTPGLPEALELLGVSVTEAGPLVILRTLPARAPLLAQAVDYAGLAGVLGTIAGDDTVFVALASQAALPALEQFLGRSSGAA